MGVFFERRFQPLSVGGFFSNQRESISRCPKSPFPSKTQNRQIARTSPLTEHEHGFSYFTSLTDVALAVTTLPIIPLWDMVPAPDHCTVLIVMIVRLPVVPVCERVGAAFLSPHPTTLHLLVGVSNPNIVFRCKALHKLVLLHRFKVDQVSLEAFTIGPGSVPRHGFVGEEVAFPVEVVPSVKALRTGRTCCMFEQISMPVFTLKAQPLCLLSRK